MVGCGVAGCGVPGCVWGIWWWGSACGMPGCVFGPGEEVMDGFGAGSDGARTGCCFGICRARLRGLVGMPPEARSLCTRWAVTCCTALVCSRTCVRVLASRATVRMPFSFEALETVVSTSVFWMFCTLRTLVVFRLVTLVT